MANWLSFIPPWNHQQTVGFLMISGGIEVNEFTQMRVILEAKFGGNCSLEVSKYVANRLPKGYLNKLN